MNTKQNERISQVSSDTLVIGVDIGEEKHYARAFDYRGLEFSRRALSFSNSAAGFNIFYKWLEEIIKLVEYMKCMKIINKKNVLECRKKTLIQDVLKM